MKILCMIGLHDWQEKARASVTDNMVFTLRDQTVILKRCARCGEWNADPRGLGFGLDDAGNINAVVIRG